MMGRPRPFITTRGPCASYFRSLAWLAILAAVGIGVSNVAGLWLIDFVHGNPHRTRENAVEMMIWFTPLFGLLAVILTVLGFTLAQCFQALVAGSLLRRFGNQAHAAVLLTLPITGLLTWCSWNYIIPLNHLGLDEGPDWTPYPHELTTAGYLGALAFQAPATVFSVAYAVTEGGQPPRKAVILLALAAAVAGGAVFGYHMAKGQFQFL
jgi:hypothetical protein